MAEKTTMVDDAQEKDELVLEDNQLVLSKPKYYPNLTFYYIEYQ